MDVFFSNLLFVAPVCDVQFLLRIASEVMGSEPLRTLDRNPTNPNRVPLPGWHGFVSRDDGKGIRGRTMDHEMRHVGGEAGRPNLSNRAIRKRWTLDPNFYVQRIST